MATTGFWPVKGNLKSVIVYAENPDKTMNPKFFDSDLYATLQYAENSNKTDQELFVSGINCSKHNAYAQMVAVKKKFGERGSVVAYHGYQSFKENEVTPEECHEIGIETARKMWGDKYQVIVTTHLDMQHHLHNHFVINSTSFKDGLKFRNKIGDHYELRKISDAICKERGKSVLENAPFYGGEKAAYWLHKQGKLINTIQQENIDVRNFISNIRQCTDLKELTPAIVNKLITKIEVFDKVIGEDGKKSVPIKIHFVGVGVMQFPDAEMLEKAKEEMKANAKRAS